MKRKIENLWNLPEKDVEEDNVESAEEGRKEQWSNPEWVEALAAIFKETEVVVVEEPVRRESEADGLWFPIPEHTQLPIDKEAIFSLFQNSPSYSSVYL